MAVFLLRSSIRSPGVSWRCLHHRIPNLLAAPEIYRHLHSFSRSEARALEPCLFASPIGPHGGGLCGIGNGVLQGIRARVGFESGSYGLRIFSRGAASAVGIGIGKEVAGGVEQGGIRGVMASLRCYVELSKARLSMLVLTTAGFGFVMGSGEVVDWVEFRWMSAGTMMTVCSANAFNQIMEIASDARMTRTMRRPLPSGRMSASCGGVWCYNGDRRGCESGVQGECIDGAAWSWESFVVYIGLHAFEADSLDQYVGRRSCWRRSSSHGLGCCYGPDRCRWTDVARSISSAGALLYFWQIPHFMALAFLCRKDYAVGRYRMLSLNGDLSGRRTALAALRNCIYLVPLGFVAQEYNVVSEYFGMEMLLLSAGFGATATSFYFSPTSITARKMFRASLLYLSVYMAAMIYQRIPNPNLKKNEMSPSRNSEIKETQWYQNNVVITDLQAIEKKMHKPLPMLIPYLLHLFPLYQLRRTIRSRSRKNRLVVKLFPPGIGPH